MIVRRLDDFEALVRFFTKVFVAKIDLCNVNTLFVGAQPQNHNKQRKKRKKFHFEKTKGYSLNDFNNSRNKTKQNHKDW
jgi:hypothetical protein